MSGRRWEPWNADTDHLVQSLYASTCLYIPAAFFTKVTLLLLIARAFAVRPIVSKGIRVFNTLLLLAYLPIQFIKIFHCRPISAYWEDIQSGGGTGNRKCFDQSKSLVAEIVVAIVTDFLILLLPIPLAWAMEAPRWQKVKVGILLVAGSGATAMCVFRAYLSVHFMHSNGMCLCGGLWAYTLLWRPLRADRFCRQTQRLCSVTSHIVSRVSTFYLIKDFGT